MKKRTRTEFGRLGFMTNGIASEPSLSSEILVEPPGQRFALSRHTFHSFKIHTATYTVPDLLMSEAGGGKVTTLKELKIKCLRGTLLSLWNSPDNPFEAEIISLP